MPHAGCVENHRIEMADRLRSVAFWRRDLKLSGLSGCWQCESRVVVRRRALHRGALGWPGLGGFYKLQGEFIHRGLRTEHRRVAHVGGVAQEVALFDQLETRRLDLAAKRGLLDAVQSL